MTEQKVFIPVSVEQELPKEEGRYVIILDTGKYATMWFNGKSFIGNHKLTHWIKESDRYIFTKEELEELLEHTFNESRLTHPLAGFKHDTAKDYLTQLFNQSK